MDAIDLKILRALQQDGRLTNNALAERVGLSPSPCLRRVRQLEKNGVIEGYTARIDREKYGLPITVFVSIRLSVHSEEAVTAFEDYIRDIDEILACYLMAGSDDYLLYVVSDSLKSYERFMRRTLNKIPNIASIESSFAFGIVKKQAALPLP